MVVEGAAGMGKSALVAIARAEAEARDVRVLWVRCAELERDWAFGAARQLVEPVLAAAAPAERAQTRRER